MYLSLLSALVAILAIGIQAQETPEDNMVYMDGSCTRRESWDWGWKTRTWIAGEVIRLLESPDKDFERVMLLIFHVSPHDDFWNWLKVPFQTILWEEAPWRGTPFDTLKPVPNRGFCDNDKKLDFYNPDVNAEDSGRFRPRRSEVQDPTQRPGEDNYNWEESDWMRSGEQQYTDVKNDMYSEAWSNGGCALPGAICYTSHTRYPPAAPFLPDGKTKNPQYGQHKKRRVTTWCGWTFDPRDDRGRPLPSKESHFDFRTDPTRYNFLKVDQFRAHLGLLLLRGSLQASRTRDVVRSPDLDGYLMFEPGTSLADIPIDSYSMAGKDMLFSTVQDFVKQYGPARATWSINSLAMLGTFVLLGSYGYALPRLDVAPYPGQSRESWENDYRRAYAAGLKGTIVYYADKDRKGPTLSQVEPGGGG